MLHGHGSVSPLLQLPGELFWHFLAWKGVNVLLHSRGVLSLVEFTCLAFQVQFPKWNARHRKAERERSLGTKQRRMTCVAKLFRLHPALRHQHPQENKRRQEKNIPEAQQSLKFGIILNWVIIRVQFQPASVGSTKFQSDFSSPE